VSIGTYATKAEADTAISLAIADQRRGGWVDPRRGSITLGLYATEWVRQNRSLAPRTRELYEGFLRNHLIPDLGHVELGRLSTSTVRSWWATMPSKGEAGASTAAKVYRFLRAILNTAVEDELIVKNPCVIKGAGSESPAERPFATPSQVDALAGAMPSELRLLVVFAAYTSLRLSELRYVRRRHINLLVGTVRVEKQLQELSDGTLVERPPKSDAGVRTVAIPPHVRGVLERHLDLVVREDADAFVFPSTTGGPFRRATVYAAWKSATSTVGMSGFRFHDLRHTGNVIASRAGAGTKDLMARMGHSSERAALIYQHASLERDAEIAMRMSEIAEGAEDHQGAEVVRLRAAEL
jgi:integrase